MLDDSYTTIYFYFVIEEKDKMAQILHNRGRHQAIGLTIAEVH